MRRPGSLVHGQWAVMNTAGPAIATGPGAARRAANLRNYLISRAYPVPNGASRGDTAAARARRRSHDSRWPEWHIKG